MCVCVCVCVCSTLLSLSLSLSLSTLVSHALVVRCLQMAYRAPDPLKQAPTQSRTLPVEWERESVADADSPIAEMVRRSAPLFDQY